MNSTVQTSGADMELRPNPATELTIPPKTAAAPFWEQCCLLWTSLAANPLLPDRPSHSLVLSNLQSLYRTVSIVVSPEVTPVTQLDHSVLESVRLFVVEHLAHVARALGRLLRNPTDIPVIVLIGTDIIARKLNMPGAAAVRGFLAADELQGFVAWVDGLVDQERDQERVWDVCGYCLLQAVTQLYEIFPMLRRVLMLYETPVTAD